MKPSSNRASAVKAGPRHLVTVRHLYVLVPIAVVAWRAVTPLGANSFLWHVRAGTLQLEAGQVLRSDPFSFITLGESWRTQSWLAEIGYGWAEQTTGSLQWVPTMMFLVMGATLAFVGIAVYRTVLDPAKTALGVVAVAWVGMLFVVPRPAIFSFLFLAVFVVVLGHPDRLGWTLVPLSWLWAAVHGLFVLGLTLVALEAIRRRSWRLMGIGAASGAVTLLTAHGLGVVQILLDFVENREALAYLSEWKRPDLLSLGLVPSIAVGAGLIAGIARRRLEISHLFVVLPFVALGVLQLRSVFPALIVLVPLASAGVTIDRAPRARAVGSQPINWSIGVAIALLAVIALARPIGRNTGVLPSAGAAAALTNDQVFHGPGAGGLLIWSQHPDRLVFIDDRAELYGAGLFGDLVAAIDGSTGTQLLDRFGLNEALVKTSWALDDVLDAEGWTETFRDDDWAVYVRP